MNVSLSYFRKVATISRSSVNSIQLYLSKQQFSTSLKLVNNDKKVVGGRGIVLDKGILASRSSSEDSKGESRLTRLTTQYPDLVTWYACGPTVYDSAHIGHASSYIRLDIIRRILESQGVSVLQVMGITDIDDKIINRSNQLGVSWNELGKKYELEFFNELAQLNIKSPQIKARVSDFIPNIINFVSELVESGYAYPTSDGSIYFDTEKYGAYNKFRLADVENVTEEDPNSGKKNCKDFAVWKGQKPGEPFWETKWGRGRPGWHIECSVMASHYFGQKLDIHSGGRDLIFPHHENEEAQCCAKFGGDQWVTHWIHTGHLILRNDVKMSKSLGNTITIQDFLEQNSAATLRMMCMLSGYSNTIEYSEESKNHAGAVLSKLESFIGSCNSILSGQCQAQQTSGSQSLLYNKLHASMTEVQSHLVTNFNVPKALGVVQDLISEFHQNIEIVSSSKASVDLALVLACKQFVENFLQLMGINDSANDARQSETLSEPILTELLRFRKLVRTYSLALEENDKDIRKQRLNERKQLTEACDEVRKNLKALGIEVKDIGQDFSWSSRRGFG